MLDKTKLEELKKKTELTEEEKAELANLEQQFSEETGKSRYEELVKKDENALTPEEVDELISLGGKFGNIEEKKPAAEQGASDKKKYAGIYESVEDLIKGINSSEAERKRIESSLSPEEVKDLESFYKDSQRKVTKLVSEHKPAARVDISKKPLTERELEEMTQAEYDAWEKSDKLGAHSWLSEATRRKSLIDASRRNVFKKYPNWMAEMQGIIEPSKELVEWDRLDREGAIDKSDPTWPEKIMAKMEDNLDIKAPVVPPKKPTTLKPGFEQGRGGGQPKGAGKKLSVAEFEALSDDERLAYLESQKPKSDR